MSYSVDTQNGALPVQFKGSRIARWLLNCIGWTAECDGMPALQGVMVVYPHTSNWDFIPGILAKWAIGLPLNFWAKDSLFRVPVFGTWLRWVGGVSVNRRAAHGLVGDMVRQIEAHKAAGTYFWIALAPEGTRKYTDGWKSGFYHLTIAAEVPLAVVALDWGARCVRIKHFIHLTDDVAADMQRIADIYEGKDGEGRAAVAGCREKNASPLRLMDRAKK